MIKSNSIRSPLFYTGDKYKIIGEIKKHFPKKINKFIEPFVGGGSVFLNVSAKVFLLNDINSNIMTLHEFLSSYKNIEDLENALFSEIKKYGLSCSYKENPVPIELRKLYNKTYFAVYNKDSFQKLKDDFNKTNEKSPIDLYLLLIYGFNRMLRFNNTGKYNVPVGNVDYNLNVHRALEKYIEVINEKKITWKNQDFILFLENINFTENDFIYFDPPYLITSSEYNKLWTQENDIKLMQIIDTLSRQNIKFAMSNVTNYKGKENLKLIEWMKNYHVYPIKSNYINYHDNSIKSFSEVLITNYEN